MRKRNAQGIYTLMLIRAEDGAVLASADLDASRGHADAMGFKYVALSTPLVLDAAPSPARRDQAARTEARSALRRSLLEVRLPRVAFGK